MSRASCLPRSSSGLSALDVAGDIGSVVWVDGRLSAFIALKLATLAELQRVMTAENEVVGEVIVKLRYASDDANAWTDSASSLCYCM